MLSHTKMLIDAQHLTGLLIRVTPRLLNFFCVDCQKSSEGNFACPLGLDHFWLAFIDA